MYSKIVTIFKRHRIYFIAPVGGFILLALLDILHCRINPSDIILTITAIILVFYTYETYRLRKAALDQTRVNIMPILALLLEKDNQKREIRCFIENFSNFPAYNVDFEEAKLLSYGATIELIVGNIIVVPPKSKIQLVVSVSPREKGHSIFNNTHQFVFNFFEKGKIRFGLSELRTSVIYDDVLGNSWKTTLGYNDWSGVIAEKPEATEKRLIKIKRRRNEEKGSNL